MMDQNKINVTVETWNEMMLSTESNGQQLNLEKSGCAKNWSGWIGCILWVNDHSHMFVCPLGWFCLLCLNQ